MNMSDIRPKATSYGEGFVREANPSNEMINWNFSWDGANERVMIIEGKINASSDGTLWMYWNGSSSRYYASELTDDNTVSHFTAMPPIRAWNEITGLILTRVKADTSFYSIWTTNFNTGFVSDPGFYKPGRGGICRVVVHTGSNIRSYLIGSQWNYPGPVTSINIQSDVNISGNIRVYRRTV
jgi:hypothetical protein